MIRRLYSSAALVLVLVFGQCNIDPPATGVPSTSTIGSIDGPADVGTTPVRGTIDGCAGDMARRLDLPCPPPPAQECPGQPGYYQPRCPHPPVATTTTTVVAVAPPPVPGVPGTAVQGRCTQYEPLLVAFAPAGGWDVAKMSRTMWRESRCEPWQHSTTADDGLLQINKINHPYLRQVLGEWVDRWSLLEPVQNVRAAAALCTFWRNAGSSCYRPWNGGA